MKQSITHSNPYRQFADTADDRLDSGITTSRGFRCPTILEFPQERYLLSARRETPDRLRSAFRNGWGRIKVWNTVIDNSLFGDILGIIALIIILCVGFVSVGIV